MSQGEKVSQIIWTESFVLYIVALDSQCFISYVLHLLIKEFFP